MREDIDRDVLRWISEGVQGPTNEERFEALARRIFAYQYENNAPYRRFCEAFGIGPGELRSWRDIPPVPTGAFKEARLATFGEEDEVRVFRTSGTSEQGRGSLHLDTLALYEASLLATFGAHLLPDRKRMPLLVLAPNAEDVPDSSLSFMFTVAVRELGKEGSSFYVSPERWEPERLIKDLEATREPVAVLGTAFAFVHLLDQLSPSGRVLRLPEGSRVMETGGFKGRSRELSREELHAGISAALAVPAHHVINQYGMCELGSQFYEASLIEGVPSRVKSVPPWVRTRVVDPDTLDELPEGDRGLLIHYDLVNTGSVIAVQTADEGRRQGEGFEILGRLRGAEARGCSLAADLLLGER